MAEAAKASVKEEEEAKKSKEMKPWEQHSAVISIPRFDYKATSSLLHSSHSGFLITCPIKREKSATKEALSILEKHVGYSCCILDSDGFEANAATKKRKICLGNGDGECLSRCGCKGNADESCNLESDASEGKRNALSLIKLTRSGLVLFTLPNDSSSNVTDVVSNIIMSLESGTLSSPLWCHRIFPIQATCSLNEKELHSVVSKHVKQFVTDNKNELSGPLKFAIGYNRRGIGETEMKDKRISSSGSHTYALLDRDKCFSVVAAAVKDAIPDSTVDLKSPVLCVLLELLPLSAVPDGSLVVAVSVLPRKLVSLKPRLCIKSLISDKKETNKK